MKKIFIIIGVLLKTHLGVGQDRLSTGDTISSELYTQLLRHDESASSSNQNEQKLLLLDFWSTYCASCVNHMPRLAELKDKYPDHLKILLVTHEGKNKVDSFLAKRAYIRSLELPMLTQDSMLSRLFPHKTIPHVVWVGKDRIIKAVTFSEFSTEKTVDHLLENNDIDLIEKREEDIDFGKPVLTADRVKRSAIVSSSIITGFVPGLRGGTAFAYPQGSLKMLIANTRLINCYFTAYSTELKLQSGAEWRNRVLLKMKDTSNFFRKSGSLTERLFCYESVIPAVAGDIEGRQKLLDKMKSDFDCFFNVRSSVSTLPVKCYIIKVRPKNASKDSAYINYSDNEISYHAEPVKSILVSFRANELFDRPVFFEGDMNELRTMVVKKSYRDFNELKTALLYNGFELREESRNLPMLIIRDR